MGRYQTRSKTVVKTENISKTLFEYPPTEKDPARRVITFTQHDQTQLRTPEYLNDTIISFFMQYHLDHNVSKELMDRIHVFSSFFFAKIKAIKTKRKAEDISYSCASRWLKGVEIFNKDFLIMPVCEKDHWILVIVCYPSRSPSTKANALPDEELYEPAVIVLNSWNGCAPSVKKALSQFLKFQWHVERKDFRYFPIHNAKTYGIKLLFPKIPQQKNNYNCGVYILNYFYCFLKDPRRTYLQMYRGRDMTKWFEENSVDTFASRRRMYEVINTQIKLWNNADNKAKRAEILIESSDHTEPIQSDNIEKDRTHSDDSIIVIH